MDKLPRDPDGQLSKFAWPGGYAIAYLDSDNSALCAECARKSDSDPDEVPQFRPVSYWVTDNDSETTCDQCSREIV